MGKRPAAFSSTSEIYTSLDTFTNALTTCPEIPRRGDQVAHGDRKHIYRRGTRQRETLRPQLQC